MAKKRVNGEGTIGKRKDGRWEARYIAVRDPETGKQIRKSILGKTQAEVRTKLKEALAEATEIDVVKSGEYNVAGWVQAWYSLYAQPNVRETTARYYKGYIDHHVIPRLGDIPLNKLTSLDIQQFYKDLLENGRIREDTKAKKPGLSSTTVHGIHVMLKSALKRAVQERLIPFRVLYPTQDHKAGVASDSIGAISVLPARGRTARCTANVLLRAVHWTSER